MGYIQAFAREPINIFNKVFSLLVVKNSLLFILVFPRSLNTAVAP
jgi:hypothetical protein